MTKLSISALDLDTELKELEELTLDQLKARWAALKGSPPPKHLRRYFLARAVAHALQEQVLGGLDAATRKRLDQLVSTIVPVGEAPPKKAPARRKLKAGTKILREWQGTVHEITVLADGSLLWRGERHKSFSVIARRITGTRWNGWAFFGLNKPAPDRKEEVARQRLVPRSKPVARSQGSRPAHG